MPANLNGSAKPDDNPKPTIQDQSPERGCGSYSRCVAPVRRGFVSSECFSLSHKRPTQGNVGLAFWVGIMHNFLPFSLCRICRKFR